MRGTAVGVLTLAMLGGSLAAGCGSDAAKRGPPPGKARANPHYGAPGAKVAVTAPKAGAVTRSPVHVIVKVTGFTLDGKELGGAPRQGVGQLHFHMDNGRYDWPRYSGANGALAKRLGVAGKYSVATQPVISYDSLPRGKHRLVASLANNDMSETGVSTSTVFRIR